MYILEIVEINECFEGKVDRCAVNQRMQEETSMERGDILVKRGNILVIGKSGVGKSTLINAVLGEERAKTSWGTSGTTDKIDLYESDKIPFRIIDTIGFEPSFFRAYKAINAVKNWSKGNGNKKGEENQINVIWFCVEGTSTKLFPEEIKNYLKATSMWETVPVIVVITKSYSIPDRVRNEEMVKEAFYKQKKSVQNLRKIIPVVASEYVISEGNDGEAAIVAPVSGIEELIQETNDLMPEGIQAGKRDMEKFLLQRKRSFAQGVIGMSTVSGCAVGAIPIPLADATLLSAIEISEINLIARIYGISKNEDTNLFFNSIVEVGTVSVVAKTAISTLKVIPGVNIAASVLNAIIAGSFIVAIGEGTTYVFEKVYLGEKSVKDIDWVKQVIESKLTSQFIENVKKIAKKAEKTDDPKKVVKIILDTFSSKKK